MHIILGVGFVANILQDKLGHDIRGTALVSTHFGNVVMGEYHENGLDSTEDENEHANVNTIIDGEMEEKLQKMIERLWEIDMIGCESIRTEEQEMVEQHFLGTHCRDSTSLYSV